MSKKNKKNKKNLNLFSGIIGVIFNITLIIFSYLIINLDVLPTKYFSLLFGILLIIAFIFNLIIFIPKVKSKLKIGTDIFAILFSIVFGVGINYLYNTADFFNKITDSKYQVENYYVVVLDNGTYDNIKDLGNDNMGIFVSNTDTYKEAREKLLDKVKTKNKDYDDANKLANDLLKENVDAMFISETYKVALDEEVDEFKESTKIIDTISIKTKNKDIVKDVKVTKQPFNIFVSGIDTYGKIASVSRSDVNMIMTVNPNTNEILLTSIPRDYYVQLNGTTGLKDKLTHAGIYGVDKSVKTLEDLFGIEINYYVRVNFTTLIDVVDVIGGIDVYSDATFVPWTDRTLKINKGMVHMDGKTALAFSRERYAYREGDRHRVKNQQDVITAIMNKILSSKTIISKYNSLLNTLDGSFQTNMDTKDLTSLIKKQLNDMSKWTITSQSVNGTDSSNYTYSYSKQKLYVMIPDMNTVTEATTKINEVLNKD